MPQSEGELVEQLLEVGNKLASPPSDPNELLSLLDQTEGFLSEVEQSPSESVSNALRPTIKALVAEKLFNQSEMDLKVAVASCITEITRITAPYAPYDDYLMKEIFRMIVDIFEKLNYISSHSYSKRVSILETVANIRSCVMMLDLECDALVLEMFQHFLKTIRPNHTQNVFSSMEAIMTLVLEESEAITPELMSCLLLSVREDNKDILPIARRLVESVINNCAVKLKPYLIALVQSTGASLSDFGCIVASVCQENSDVPVQNELNASGGCLDSDNLERKISTASDRSPKLAISNGAIPTVNGNSVVEPNSPEQKSERSCRIVQSQTATIACRAELDNLSCSTDVRLETLTDLNTEGTGGRKSNSLIQLNTDSYSRRGSGKEAPAVRCSKGGGSKKADSSPSDGPSGKGAAALMCPQPDNKVEHQPAENLDSEHVFVSSETSAKILPDITRPKGARPSGFTEKHGSIVVVAHQPACSSVHKGASENCHIGEETSTFKYIDINKEHQVISHSQGKPLRRSLRKELQENAVDGVTPVKDVSSKKEVDGVSNSVVKPLEHASKKGSTIGTAERESSGKQQKSKIKQRKKDVVEEPSSKIYEAQTHEKELNENLIGSRIEVWWPDDKVFYPGVVDAYDPVSNEHRVVYYDGDVEKLLLKDERWKFVEEFSKAHGQGQEGDIQSSNVPFKKRGKVKPSSEVASKVANKTTIPTVKNSGGSEASATINLPQKRPFAENETETKRDDLTNVDGTNKDQKKAKALECSMGSLQENESDAKEQKTTGRMGISNSPASFQDPSPASTPRRLGQFRDSQDEVLDAFSNVSIISRILVKTTDEHSAEVAEVRNISVNDEEIEDLKAIEAEKRIEREKRRKQEPAAIVAVPSPLPPKAFLFDDVQVDLSEHIFDCAFMKKIRIFCQIIENKWYEINTEPLTNYAELADEFGRNAAFDHGNLFKATRQFPHYRGLDASETEAREDLWYELPLVFEGIHKSFQSQKYLQKNIETIRRWFTKLAQSGFDISVPLAAFYLLTVTPTDFKKFRELLNSVSLQLNEERLNVETLKSKLPVTKRMAELDSKIEDVKKQLRDLESERMSLDQLKGVELELEKYGTTVKACRLEKLKVLYEKEMQEAQSFLREVSLDGFLELTELTSLTQ